MRIQAIRESHHPAAGRPPAIAERSSGERASSTGVRSGRVLSALPVGFLLLDAVIKLMAPPPVTESFTRLGYRAEQSLGIGLLELACLAVYLFPRTCVLGAVLLTGYLGGATATHVRVGDPLLSHVLFPTYVAALLWGGVWLREERLRALLPLRR
jgi:hypothetical protein